MAGVIGWHELFTDDVERASLFYAELLGTEIETAQMGDFDYPMLKRDGKTHCGFVRKPDGGPRNHWYPYVVVDDVDAAVERATSLGAELYHGPGEVEGEGIRFAVLGDPQHATFGVLSSPNPPASGLFVWDELHATDTQAAKQYYTGLFGWTATAAMENYEFLSAGETQVGGLYADGETPGAYWLTYLTVDDVDAAHEKAKSLGASEIIAPADIPNIGRFSVINDPTGAEVGLYKSAN